MKSPPVQIEPVERSFAVTARNIEEPKPLGSPRWDWARVNRVLVVRLRSIGDTVLSTPSLVALRRFLPNARIDVLLESWVAPLLDGFPHVDNVITVERSSLSSRLDAVRQLRKARYDVAYNLHGGSTSTLIQRAAGARHRVGYEAYRYSWMLNHQAPPSSSLWQSEHTHSAEQQLALLGWTGVPVSDRPSSKLSVTSRALESVSAKLESEGITSDRPIALLHPAAAFATKQWATENFARVAEHLAEFGLRPVAVVGPNELPVLSEMRERSAVPVVGFSDLTLPEVTALSARARIFVGNDSGLAHIAAAVRTPSVVVFGSSNVHHWRPWSSAPNEVVREEMPCAPCPGYRCNEFDEPECIKRVGPERVIAAVDRILYQ